MQKITKEEKNNFINNGWVLVPLNIEKNQIKKYLKAAKKMRKKAIKIKYRPGRVYFDHLFKFNLAAIEAPFNSIICGDEIKNFFLKINLGAMVKDLMSWNDTYCSLARLFCMGNYNYRGNWHRDKSLKQRSLMRNEVVQAMIYFDHQSGFRILKSEFDFGGSKTLIPTIEASNKIQAYEYPLSPLKECYEVLSGTPGSVLFFDPLRFHQGSYSSSRLDFHMRFQNSEKIPSERSLSQNTFQDFKIHDYLHSNYDLNSKIIKELGFIQRQSIKTRLSNTINNLSGFTNRYRIFQQKKNLSKEVLNFGSPDITANTIFQKIN